MAKNPKWLTDYRRELRNAKRRAATLERNTGLMTAFNELGNPTSARQARMAIRQLRSVSTAAYQRNKLPGIVYAESVFETPWGDRQVFRYSARQARELERLERAANRTRRTVGLSEVDFSSGRAFTSPAGYNRYVESLRGMANLRGALSKRRRFVENYIQGLETALGGDVDVFINRVIDRINTLGIAAASQLLQNAIDSGINIHVFAFASDQSLIQLNIATIARFWGVDLRE